MRRFVLTALMALLAGSSVADAAPATSTSLSPSPRRALVRDFVCQRAREPAQRELSVQAVMRPLIGTQKMALRFQVLSRTKDTGPFKEVSGHYLGSWVMPSDPTLGQRPDDVWIVNHPVLGVAAPATYRFRVTFRWTDAQDRVLDTVVRLSPKCFQPELRPDLSVQSIAVKPIAGSPTLDRYVAQIVNSGASDAGPFEVLFAPGRVDPVQTVDVKLLAAHASLTEKFVGPACSATTMPTVTVDPLHQVSDDLNPANNSLTAACPSS